jgi:hypothetical protein
VDRPDILGGDTNFVEDAIDRLPSHPDSKASVDTFDDLKKYLGLIDGWRETYPTTRTYTFMQALSQGGSQSRIDRIYIKRDLFEDSFEWEMQAVGIEPDHRMVTMRLTTEDAPTIGHGRWVWPAHIIRDKTLTKFIHDEGVIIQTELAAIALNEANGQWNPRHNAQTIWVDFKTKICAEARKRAKIIVPKMVEEIAEVKNKIDLIENDKDLSEEEIVLSCAVLQEKLTKLEQKRHQDTRLTAQVRNRMEGEVINRYWTGINKPHKPREIIHRLRKDGNGELPQYEIHSQKMADMACKYHKQIQSDRTRTPPRVRNEKIQTVLGRTTRKTTADQDRLVKARLTLEDVRYALRKSSNYKAPGLDRITYEVWKILDQRYESRKAAGRPAFDILGAMHKVYNDIEKYGMVKGTGFSKSWMCPLYEKNDKANIANYRPISLLNTDYKVFTKALTIKLAEVAPNLIHPNQAGFVPGRQIRDQIWLTKRVIELAEATERDGVIVALDQEKAYDKVEHNYLWRALASYGIPREFINTIKALYSDAHTYVCVNAEMSSHAFRVTRGVRQGDPLSCLLFDLAIEPLAESLRQSNLKGFKIRDKQD